ncbi:MAG TPA: IS1182 family transposase [Pseudonocardiaceae bacterium]|jgi:transposase|nr:IS1182 family transposase [Pseudonocardiaceae bacterium]
MLGPPKRRCLDRPIAASIEALIPPDNFYRHLDAKLDLGFVRDWVRHCYAAGGRPSIDPVVFFRLQLIMFFEGIRSERRLMEIVALNLAHRWYLGYALDEPLPDHSSLTRIRARLGLPIFERFFVHVVELCQAAGLVWGKELFFDATKVRANAGVDSLVPRWHAEATAHLDELFVDTPTVAPPAEGMAADAVDLSAAARLPFAGTPEDEAHLAAENQATWKLLEEHRLNPARPPSGRGYRRTADRVVSTTDADALPLQTGARAALGYRDHYVVDGGEARIILAALVTAGDVMDNTPMLDLLHRVRFRWHLHPKRAVGDAKYGTIENIRALEDTDIRAYVPRPDLGERPSSFGASRFTDDAERDEYRCPQDEPLRKVRTKYTEAVTVYQAAATACNPCPLKAQCTPSTHGRQLYRSFHAEYLDRVRAYHQTTAYQKAMRKRAVWVEPLFGEAKDWHGLRRFRLRRLWRVNCEGLLVAAGQNLKRWLTRTGWGRRYGPAGSLALSCGAVLFRR